MKNRKVFFTFHLDGNHAEGLVARQVPGQVGDVCDADGKVGAEVGGAGHVEGGERVVVENRFVPLDVGGQSLAGIEDEDRRRLAKVNNRGLQI